MSCLGVLFVVSPLIFKTVLRLNYLVTLIIVQVAPGSGVSYIEMVLSLSFSFYPVPQCLQQDLTHGRYTGNVY